MRISRPCTIVIKSDVTIFIVDDDASVLKALKRLIMSAGLNVREYSLAHSFLNCGYENQEGVIILDVQMPEMSGIEVQKSCRFRLKDTYHLYDGPWERGDEKSGFAGWSRRLFSKTDWKKCNDECYFHWTWEKPLKGQYMISRVLTYCRLTNWISYQLRSAGRDIIN